LIEELANFKTNILIELNQLKGVATKTLKAKEVEEPLALYYQDAKRSMHYMSAL